MTERIHTPTPQAPLHTHTHTHTHTQTYTACFWLQEISSNSFFCAECFHYIFQFTEENLCVLPTSQLPKACWWIDFCFISKQRATLPRLVVCLDYKWTHLKERPHMERRAEMMVAVAGRGRLIQGEPEPQHGTTRLINSESNTGPQTISLHLRPYRNANAAISRMGWFYWWSSWTIMVIKI